MDTELDRNAKIAESMKGNKNATKNKLFLDQIKRHLTQNPQKLEKIVEGLVEAAMDQESWAVKEIMDRVDGKAHQSTSIEDAEGNNLLQAIEVRFVKPSE